MAEGAGATKAQLLRESLELLKMIRKRFRRGKFTHERPDGSVETIVFCGSLFR